MPIELIPTFLVSLFAIGYTPGPANIYSLSCAITHGRRRSMKMWYGLLAGFITAALLAAVLAHFAGIALGFYVAYVKYIGAAYILYLAWKTYKASSGSTKKDTDCSFASGFIVQLTNVKMILFDITAYSTLVLPYSNRFVDLLPVAALLLIAGPGANLLWLVVGSSLSNILIKHQKTVNIIMALALFACAVMIVLP